MTPKEEIEQKISAGNFSTWFQDTSLLSTEDGHIIIGVKNSFFIKQLRSKFLDIIKDALANNGIKVKDIDVILVVDNSNLKIEINNILR